MNPSRPAAAMLRLALLVTAGCSVVSASVFAATPAFSVHKNGVDQSVTAETEAKLTWSTEAFDTNNNFSSDRFTPTVAGKYLIVVSAQCLQAGQCAPAIFKNGVLLARSQATNFNTGQTPQATAIVDMNGSTDYVEAFVYSSGSAIGGSAYRTYFSGMQVDGGGSGGTTGINLIDASDLTGTGYSAAVGGTLTEDNNNACAYATVPMTGDFETSINVGTITGAEWFLGVFQASEVGAFNSGSQTGGMQSMTNSFYVGTDSSYPIFKGSSSVNSSFMTSNANYKIVRSGGTIALKSGTTTVYTWTGTNTNPMHMAICHSNGHSGNTLTSVFATNGPSGGGSSQWSDGSAGAIYYNSGNVGIGTTSPANKLHVEASSTSTALVYINNTGGSGASTSAVFRGGANNAGVVNFQVQDSSGNGDLTITGDGNAGIGTTSPIDKLEVSGGIHTSSNATTSKASEAWFDFLVGGNLARIATMGPDASTNGALSITSYRSNGSNPVTFFYGSTAGNVGIGTTTPVVPLHVLGQVSNEVARFQGRTDVSNNRSFVSIYNTNPNFWWEFAVQDPNGGATTNGLAFRERSASASVERLFISQGGNVGVGTTSPAAKLDVSGTLRATEFTGPWDSSASGYIRLGDVQIAWGDYLAASGSLPSTSFPASFVAAPAVTLTAVSATSAAQDSRLSHLYAVTTTGFQAVTYRDDGVRSGVGGKYIAIGRWR